MNMSPGWLRDQGITALQRGDAQGARSAFERLEAAGRGSHQLRLLTAQACAMLGDTPAAQRALDRVLAEEPSWPAGDDQGGA